MAPALSLSCALSGKRVVYRERLTDNIETQSSLLPLMRGHRRRKLQGFKPGPGANG